MVLQAAKHGSNEGMAPNVVREGGEGRVVCADHDYHQIARAMTLEIHTIDDVLTLIYNGVLVLPSAFLCLPTLLENFGCIACPRTETRQRQATTPFLNIKTILKAK